MPHDWFESVQASTSGSIRLVLLFFHWLKDVLVSLIETHSQNLAVTPLCIATICCRQTFGTSSQNFPALGGVVLLGLLVIHIRGSVSFCHHSGDHSDPFAKSKSLEKWCVFVRTTPKPHDRLLLWWACSFHTAFSKQQKHWKYQNQYLSLYCRVSGTLSRSTQLNSEQIS